MALMTTMTWKGIHFYGINIFIQLIQITSCRLFVTILLLEIKKKFKDLLPSVTLYFLSLSSDKGFFVLFEQKLNANNAKYFYPF